MNIKSTPLLFAIILTLSACGGGDYNNDPPTTAGKGFDGNFRVNVLPGSTSVPTFVCPGGLMFMDIKGASITGNGEQNRVFEQFDPGYELRVGTISDTGTIVAEGWFEDRLIITFRGSYLDGTVYGKYTTYRGCAGDWLS